MYEYIKYIIIITLICNIFHMVVTKLHKRKHNSLIWKTPEQLHLKSLIKYIK